MALLSKNELERVGRIAHEVNRAVSEAYGKTDQVPWEDASEEDRRATFAGVQALADSQGGGSAEEEHNRWLRDKLDSGWTYGPVRDNANKVHPGLIPWDRLLETTVGAEMKVKSVLYRAAVLAALGIPVPSSVAA